MFWAVWAGIVGTPHPQQGRAARQGLDEKLKKIPVSLVIPVAVGLSCRQFTRKYE
jgi:hypothetical protein